tara:strand:- start:30966 stop:31184 length:219 start_codon:yes stop_codon:yes gene_type:complete
MNSLDKIEVTVNDNKHSFREEETLQSVISKLSITENGIAIAINEQIIPKKKWTTTQLNNNDKILVIKATQGG